MKPLRVGEVIDNYCNGYFGSRAFGSKKVVAFGWNWLLVRVESDFDSDSYLAVAEFDNFNQMMELVEEWRKEND